MQYTKNGPDDGKPEYTGKVVYLTQVEEIVKTLVAKLEDRESGLGMNESYRMALEDLLASLSPHHQ